MYDRVKRFKHMAQHDEFWGSLAKNSMWAFIGDALASVVGLAITIILIHILGSDEYGIFVLGQTYMTIMDIIVNVQSWKGVIQYGQAAIVGKDLKQLGGYVRLGTVLDLSTAFLCGVLAITVAPFVGSILQWNDELIICSQLFSIVIFSHFAGTPTAILRLANRFDLVAWQKFLSAMLKLVAFGVIWILRTELSLTMVTVIYVIAETVGNLLLTVFAIVIYQKRFKLKYIFIKHKKTKTKEFVKYTLWGTLVDVFDLPVNYFDMFIVSTMGTDYVAVYKVFKQVINVFQKVTSSIQQSIMPQLSDLYARGKKKRGYEVIIKIRNVTLMTSIPVALLIGFSSPIWLNMFYGELYSNEWMYLLGLLLSYVIALSYASIHPYFLSLGKSKQTALYTLITNIVYIIVAYILVVRIGFGGMIVAFLIQSLSNICLKTISIRKELKNEKKD